MKREWTKKIWLKSFVLLSAIALGLTASAATYTWVGTANGGDGATWADTKNWTVPTSDTDDTPIEPTALPSSSDTVTIGEAATITLADNAHTGALVINAAVTLTGNMILDSASGNGTLTLSAVNVADGGEGRTIDVPLIVAGKLRFVTASTYAINSSLSGDASSSVEHYHATGGASQGFQFNENADVTGFKGSYYGGERNGWIRDCTIIRSTINTSADAVWKIAANGDNSVIQTDNTTYNFGQLTSPGFSLKSRTGVNLSIGARGGESSVVFIKGDTGTGNSITKVGADNLKLSGAIANVYLNAGSLELTDTTAVPAAISMKGTVSLTFDGDYENDAAYISIVTSEPAEQEGDDPTVVVTTPTVSVADGKTVTLADSFTGATGFTKDGAGILELTAVPAWSGTTTIAGTGALIVPASASLTLAETAASLSLPNDRLMIYNTSSVNVWTGAAADNKWYTAENWSKGTLPTADEAVLIPESEGDLTLMVTADPKSYSGNLTIMRDVTISRTDGSTSYQRFYITTVSGPGTLTLNGGDSSSNNAKMLFVGAQGSFTVNCDLEIKRIIRNDSGSALTLYGAFLGDGEYNCRSKDGQEGIKFYGDTTRFEGEYYGGGRADWTRDGTRFLGDNSTGSALATWKFSHEQNSGGGEVGWPITKAGEYVFGALNSPKFRAHVSGVDLTVGAKGDSIISGKLEYEGNIIRKVGSATKLDLTLADSDGTVQAKEGTLNLLGTTAPAILELTGKDATVTVADTVQIDSGEEDLEETTEVDESKTAFIPTLSAALTAEYCKIKAVAGEEFTTYTVDYVAQVGETQYHTIADAVAAATGDDKAITLLQSTEEPVVLTTVGQTLTPGEFTCGAVSAVAGLGLKEEDGVYTAQDNSAATWQGDAAGADWTVGSNWSTGYAPDSATAVTIPATEVEGGWIIYVGGNAQAKSIVVLGNTTVQRDSTLSNNGNIVVQESITTGETPATLTLNSAFIFAGPGEVAVSCPIDCKNGNSSKVSGFRSNESNGSFSFASTLTGTGTFEFRKPTTLSQDLDVVEGLTVKFDGINPTFTNDAVLKGEGTVVFTVEPSLAIQNMLRQASKWTGVCELNNVSKSGWNFSSYGNTSSTVRLNGVTGYMGFNSNTSPKNDATVKVLDIASGGLTLGNAYHSKTVVFDATKITGSGAIKIGTQSNTSDASNVTKYVFTGDMSEFTGTLDFGTLSSCRPEIIIATSSSNLPTPTDYGQIIVAEGATAYVNNTWTAPGAMVVVGNVIMGASGAIAGDNGVAGAGTITYSALPTAGLAFRDTTYTSALGTIPVWSGNVVLPATTISAKTAIPLIGLSSSNGTIVVKGITRSTTSNSLHLNSGTATIKGKVQLDGDLNITDGNSNSTYTWNEITGTGKLLVTAAGGSASGITHAITKLSDYTGEITAESSVSLTIGTVNVSSFTIGQKMVDLSDNCNLTTSPGSITVEVNGSSLDNHHLFKAADGDLYVIAAQVTVDETTTYFATLEAAAEFALANDAQIAKVDAATPTELPGWSYDKGYFTKLDIAQVGETTYKTLAAAIATGTTDDIVLIANCAETVTLGEGQTIKPGTYAFSGVLKGAGTIYYAAKPTTVPTFEDWTGTFVADWEGAKGTQFPANDYGIEGSVVEVRKLAGGYVSGTNADITIVPTISIPEECTMKLDNGYSGKITTFTKLTGAGTLTIEGYTCYFNTLENFTGTITAAQNLNCKIVDIVTTATITPGTCLVKGGTFTAVASTTVNGSAPSVALTARTGDDAGLYFDPVASITVDEVTTYYNALQEAVDAVGNNIITIVKAGGTATLPVGSVKIANTELEYTATYLEGAYYTKTTTGEEYTTYLCRVAAASASIGGNVSYYSTVQDAYTAVNVSGNVGDSFTVLDDSFSSEIDGYSYDAETHTYTKVATVAQVQSGVNTYSYTTLAAACAGADTYEVTTVTLLVARDTIDEVTPTGWTYNTPEASGTTYGTLTKQSSIDPTTPGSSYASTAMTEADAITAAKAAIVVPAGASVEAADYAEYFTYGVAGEAGAYTVTIAGLSDEVVVEPVETSAIAALQSEAVGDQVTVTVKPGLYYGFVSGETPTLADPAEYTLATGTSMSFAKPTGSGKGFVKVVISPAPKSNN